MTLLEGLIKTCLFPAFSALFYRVSRQREHRTSGAGEGTMLFRQSLRTETRVMTMDEEGDV